MCSTLLLRPLPSSLVGPLTTTFLTAWGPTLLLIRWYLFCPPPFLMWLIGGFIALSCSLTWTNPFLPWAWCDRDPLCTLAIRPHLDAISSSSAGHMAPSSLRSPLWPPVLLPTHTTMVALPTVASILTTPLSLTAGSLFTGWAPCLPSHTLPSLSTWWSKFDSK